MDSFDFFENCASNFTQADWWQIILGVLVLVLVAKGFIQTVSELYNWIKKKLVNRQRKQE